MLDEYRWRDGVGKGFWVIGLVSLSSRSVAPELLVSQDEHREKGCYEGGWTKMKAQWSTNLRST